MSLKSELGRAVRLHRERMGLTQLQLGEAIGRSVQAVGNIERGRSLPGLDTLEAIAEALQTPLREFFPAQEIPQDEVSRRTIARIAGLSEPERVWIDAVLTEMIRRPKP
jgi:transcriptional regulator with XRE-family HTH domain